MINNLAVVFCVGCPVLASRYFVSVKFAICVIQNLRLGSIYTVHRSVLVYYGQKVPGLSSVSVCDFGHIFKLHNTFR